MQTAGWLLGICASLVLGPLVWLVAAVSGPVGSAPGAAGRLVPVPVPSRPVRRLGRR